MHRLSRLAGLCLLAVASASAQAGPLTGKKLGATGSFLNTDSAVVGPAVEFRTINFVDFDFDGDGLLTISNTSVSRSSFGSGFTYRFSDELGTIDGIIGATLISATGVEGLEPSALSFTANSVSIVLNDVAFPRGTAARIALSFEPPAEILEPGSLAVFAAGLAGLLRLRRRPGRAG